MGFPLNAPWLQQAIEKGLIDREQLERPATRAVAKPAGLPAAPPFDCAERVFQAAVKKLAEDAGWLFFHPHDSRKSEPGYPDCTMVRGGVLIFAELKTATGEFTAEQRTWLRALEAVPGVNVFRWRPADWPEIVAALGPA